jgi:hypothetical protein
MPSPSNPLGRHDGSTLLYAGVSEVVWDAQIHSLQTRLDEPATHPPPAMPVRGTLTSARPLLSTQSIISGPGISPPDKNTKLCSFRAFFWAFTTRTQHLVRR